MSRRRRLLVAYPVLAEFLKPQPARTWRVEVDVPDDLRVVGIEDHPYMERFVIYVESDTFPDNPEMAEPPMYEPVYRRVEEAIA